MKVLSGPLFLKYIEHHEMCSECQLIVQLCRAHIFLILQIKLLIKNLYQLQAVNILISHYHWSGTGPVVVGSIGDHLQMDYTTNGDTTNLAARMENMARPSTIVATAYTHKVARDYFDFRSLGKVQLKGKKEAREV